MRMTSVHPAFVLTLALAAGCWAQQNSKPQRQQVEDPCQNKARVVPDATYCDRYWECVNGQPELYDCPNGLVFAGKHRGVTEGCDYPWRANYCEEKQLANGPISTEHCDWLYGIFGHESSCTRYWTCWNGTATEQLCIGGLLYNEDTHSCDWPDNVDGCQKHPLCVDDANGNVPLGKSCNRYWQCQGGYPRLQRCPAMLVFDRQSLRCVVPPTEDCDIPTTPAPSGDDIDEDNNNGGGENVPSQNYPQQPPRPQQRPQPQQQQQQQQQQHNHQQQQQQQQQHHHQQQQQQQPQQRVQQQQNRRGEQVQVLPNQSAQTGRTSGTINIHVPPGAIPLPVRPGSGARARQQQQNNN